MSDNFQQHDFDQDNFEFDSWGPGRDSDEVFVSRVRWFGGHTWRGNWFAAGWFAGVGVDGTAVAAIDYKCTNTRPMFKAKRTMPQFHSDDARLEFASEASDKWS